MGSLDEKFGFSYTDGETVCSEELGDLVDWLGWGRLKVTVKSENLGGGVVGLINSWRCEILVYINKMFENILFLLNVNF